MARKKAKENILVIGGGVAGMQSAIQCSKLGFKVYLLDETSSIGGHMSQLDKTFPTNDCAMCILSPRMHEVKSQPGVELLTYCRLEAVEGEPGNFNVVIRKLPRFVDSDKCIGCGTCTEKCPVEIPNLFNLGLNETKAIHQLYPQAVPAVPVIEKDFCRYFLKGKCRICEKLCPTKAIDFSQTDELLCLKVGAIINATGFRTFDPCKIPDYNYSSSRDILTSLEFERLLSPTGPTGGELVRLSDNSAPRKVAFIQCVGSRDVTQNRPYCSEICCLITFKQAMLALERGGVEEITIFCIDRRAQEKEGEEYLVRLQKNEKVRFIKGKVAKIVPVENGSLELSYSDLEGGYHTYNADMAVLAVGMEARNDGISEILGLQTGPWGFASCKEPGHESSRKGVYVCGGVRAPKSIPSTVLDSEAVAAEVCELLGMPSISKDMTVEGELLCPSDVRIGVFICRCGTNIASVVDTGDVVEYARSLPNVVWVQENLFSCSSDATREMAKTVKEKGITRLLVASCTPRTHLPIFQDVMKQAGMNPGFVAMANIREQCAWVHKSEPQRATAKAKNLVKRAVGKIYASKPLSFLKSPIVKRALILGGGVSGLTSALFLANQGIDVVIVEKSERLGGRGLCSLEGFESGVPDEYCKNLIKQVLKKSNIRVFLNAQLTDFSGSAGNFASGITIKDGEDEKSLEIVHGALIIAIGARLLEPRGLFGYGSVEGVVTQSELEKELVDELEKRKWCDELSENCIRPSGAYFESHLSRVRHLCMIQCVGSRNDERPYCSRVCCTRAVRHALVLKSLYPHMNITILYRDIRTYGFNELLYQQAREEGVVFVRYTSDSLPEVSPVRLGKRKAIRVVVKNKKSAHDQSGEDRNLCFTVDKLVLSEATIPTEDHGDLSKQLKLPLSVSGFFMERHLKLGPAETQLEGVYVCGQAHYPKTISESITQAGAVSAKALSLLSRDMKVGFSPAVSVNNGRCVRCLTCVRVCPYGVPVFKDGKIFIDKLKCQGCGICVAECPNRAIEPDVEADSQIVKELEPA